MVHTPATVNEAALKPHQTPEYQADAEVSAQQAL